MSRTEATSLGTALRPVTNWAVPNIAALPSATSLEQASSTEQGALSMLHTLVGSRFPTWDSPSWQCLQLLLQSLESWLHLRGLSCHYFREALLNLSKQSLLPLCSCSSLYVLSHAIYPIVLIIWLQINPFNGMYVVSSRTGATFESSQTPSVQTDNWYKVSVH